MIVVILLIYRDILVMLTTRDKGYAGLNGTDGAAGDSRPRTILCSALNLCLRTQLVSCPGLGVPPVVVLLFQLARVCLKMEAQTYLREDPTASLKLRIIQQQELAANLARTGNAPKARSARDALLSLLNKLDLLEAARA